MSFNPKTVRKKASKWCHNLRKPNIFRTWDMMVSSKMRQQNSQSLIWPSANTSTPSITLQMPFFFTFAGHTTKWFQNRPIFLTIHVLITESNNFLKWKHFISCVRGFLWICYCFEMENVFSRTQLFFLPTKKTTTKTMKFCYCRGSIRTLM